MKKERSAFFQNQSASYYYPNPSVPYPMTTQSNSNFYQGPIQNQPKNDFDEIDTRLSKIERSIKRLDTRVSKLEDMGTSEIHETNNNMYML